MLQEQESPKNEIFNQREPISELNNSKGDKPLKQSQLDFQKNYPKNIFIPMIEYLAQLGLKEAYEACVGSRQEFQGKNVVSLGLIHKLMGADWFKENVQKHVLICNISNKILLNSKIKKKLFHLYIIKNLFEVYDQDLKQFKKRISKLANSISQITYVQDQLFEYPSAILYLLRYFYQLISSHEIIEESKQMYEPQIASPSKVQIEQVQMINQDKSPSQDQLGQANQELNKSTKQGSKEEYKYYIRKIIHLFNGEHSTRKFMDRFENIERSLLNRQAQLIQKYDLPQDVPAWNVFITKVVQRCFQYYRKSAKITHAMMNEWINNFKECITTTKGFSDQHLILTPKISNGTTIVKAKRNLPYWFTPFILQYSPH